MLQFWFAIPRFVANIFFKKPKPKEADDLTTTCGIPAAELLIFSILKKEPQKQL